MHGYERALFDELLATATQNLSERLVYHHGGLAAARRSMTAADTAAEQTTSFVQALFREQLLDSLEGACFILRALPRQLSDAMPASTIEEAMKAMALNAFARVLQQRTLETLERELLFSEERP